MAFEAHPVTAERWPDLVELFDRPVARTCFCMYYRKTGEATGVGAVNRRAMQALVDAGTVPGLIGYEDGVPVAWVSLGPREEYPKLRRSPVMKPVDERPVWSIVCFFVDRDARGRGLAERMLRAAVDYARSRGARLLEAYPSTRSSRATRIRCSSAPSRCTTVPGSGRWPAAGRPGRSCARRSVRPTGELTDGVHRSAVRRAAGGASLAGRAGPDDYRGVGMGQIFGLAQRVHGHGPRRDRAAAREPDHEVRVGAVSIMDWQARSKKTTAERRRELFELYIRRHDRIDTWDLVDRSAIWVVGEYLVDKPRDVLYELAASARPMERRTAILSTFAFIRRGDSSTTRSGSPSCWSTTTTSSCRRQSAGCCAKSARGTRTARRVPRGARRDDAARDAPLRDREARQADPRPVPRDEDAAALSPGVSALHDPDLLSAESSLAPRRLWM